MTAPPDLRLWHGGKPDLRPGGLITPPGEERTEHLVDGCPVCEARRAGTPLPDDDARTDRVYVTTDRDYARIYASGWPRGALYVVEPIGELQEAPDPAPSWSCTAARVISVYDPVVIADAKFIRRVLRRYGAERALR